MYFLSPIPFKFSSSWHANKLQTIIFFYSFWHNVFVFLISAHSQTSNKNKAHNYPNTIIIYFIKWLYNIILQECGVDLTLR